MAKAKAQPQAEQGGYGETRVSQTVGPSMPSQIPPSSEGSLGGTEGPGPTMAGMGDASPALPVTQGAAAGIAAWNNNRQIIALWSINQNRNAWVGVNGIGWKKLANNSDSAIVALTMLSAHAREQASVVHYRDESDGMIHELYVW